MSSKEALKKLCDLATPNGECLNYVIGLSGTILQSLERLELLEKENQELKEQLKLSNESQETVINTMHLVNQENQKLEKALDKACERLDWDCPVSQDLISDLDCEQCNGNEKECWKKYFLKEVLGNE